MGAKASKSEQKEVEKEDVAKNGEIFPEKLAKEQAWSQMYWEGFSPEAVGAQSLSSSDGSHVDLIRGYLERKGPPFADEFFFTKEVTSKGKEYRLWHQDCFLGATRSEISNPGRYNLMFLIRQDKVVSIENW